MNNEDKYWSRVHLIYNSFLPEGKLFYSLCDDSCFNIMELKARKSWDEQMIWLPQRFIAVLFFVWFWLRVWLVYILLCLSTLSWFISLTDIQVMYFYGFDWFLISLLDPFSYVMLSVNVSVYQTFDIEAFKNVMIACLFKSTRWSYKKDADYYKNKKDHSILVWQNNYILWESME